MGDDDNEDFEDEFNQEQGEQDFDDNEMPEMKEKLDDVDSPKNEIQKLSGELSQKIRDYNGAQETPDAETNKFAAGMVISAALEGLSEKDKEDILKKLQSDEKNKE